MTGDIELEEIDLTDDSAEDDAFNYPGLCNFGGKTETEPGLLIGAELEERQDVVCEEGVLKIPKGKVLNTIQPGAAWGIEDGVITVGYAHDNTIVEYPWDEETGDEETGTTREAPTPSRAGVIKSCVIRALTAEDTDGVTPTTHNQRPIINNGELIIPLCQTIHEAGGTSDINKPSPGAIRGLIIDDGSENPGAGACHGITDGIIYIDLKNLYAKAESNNLTFDDKWFTVEDNIVSLKEEALKEVVDELVNEMSVEVNASGLLEKTEYGDLKANTAGTLSLNTIVEY
jgi:hypothetical protein